MKTEFSFLNVERQIYASLNQYAQKNENKARALALPAVLGGVVLNEAHLILNIIKSLGNCFLNLGGAFFYQQYSLKNSLHNLEQAGCSISYIPVNLVIDCIKIIPQIFSSLKDPKRATAMADFYAELSQKKQYIMKGELQERYLDLISTSVYLHLDNMAKNYKNIARMEALFVLPIDLFLNVTQKVITIFQNLGCFFLNLGGAFFSEKYSLKGALYSLHKASVNISSLPVRVVMDCIKTIPQLFCLIKDPENNYPLYAFNNPQEVSQYLRANYVTTSSIR